MALVNVKLYDTDGEFLKDAAITAGAFSTLVDQGIGNKGIKAKSVDDVGNLSAFCAEKYYYAGCLNTPECDLLDDSGASASDNLTNDATPRIEVGITLPIPTGSSEVANKSVKSFELHHKKGTTGTYEKVVDLSGITQVGNDTFTSIYQFTSDLADDDHYFKAKWFDPQDGESQFGPELHIVVDTSAPKTPDITLDDGSVFVGQSINISGTATE